MPTGPANADDAAGFLPHMDNDFEDDGEEVRKQPGHLYEGEAWGARIVAHLRGRGDGIMNTDEIMALTRGD